jgi:hypothetical protein
MTFKATLKQWRFTLILIGAVAAGAVFGHAARAETRRR